MAKVLVLYYSAHGHIERMAEAVAEGVRQAVAEAVIKLVPELVLEEVARKSGYKLDQQARIATVNELPEYDAIIFGNGTRYGNMTAQMKNFTGQTGKLWVSGALVGKAGSVPPAWRPGVHHPDVPTGAASRDDHRGLPCGFQGQMAFPRSWAIHPTAHRQSRTAAVAGGHERLSSTARAIKAAM
jgi:hypothetical protein